MWEPDPAWQALPGGPSGARLWRAGSERGSWVVKRLTAPTHDEPRLRSDPTHPGYWRREADVAADPRFVDGPGLVPVPSSAEEDGEGVTLWAEEVAGEPPTGLLVAASLGRFAAAPADPPRWAARDLLRRRIELAEQRDGWRTLGRTTLADVTERLWSRRRHWLDRLESLPQGRVHGDAVPGTFLAVRDGAVATTDWQCVGVGPVGADLGYWSLSSREDFEVLLHAFCGADRIDAEAATTAARVTAAYTVLARAEWALAQAARGEGALAGKFRHPAVAPYLRAVQRQFPQIEPLLS